jgi:hypothetical protein
MKDVGKFYGHFVYFTAIWYILWSFWYILLSFGIFCGHFGIFFPVLVCCTKYNLATVIFVTIGLHGLWPSVGKEDLVRSRV